MERSLEEAETDAALLPRPLNDATGTLESVALKMKRLGPTAHVRRADRDVF